MARMTRRTALGAAAAAAAGALSATQASAGGQTGKAVVKGRLKQSVSRWCYGKIPMPRVLQGGRGHGAHRDRSARREGVGRGARPRPHLLDGLCRRRHDPGRVERAREPRRDREELRREDPARRQTAGPERDHVLRQPARHAGRGSHHELHRRAEPREEDRRGAQRHDLRRAAEQQSGSQGLSG